MTGSNPSRYISWYAATTLCLVLSCLLLVERSEAQITFSTGWKAGKRLAPPSTPTDPCSRIVRNILAAKIRALIQEEARGLAMQCGFYESLHPPVPVQEFQQN